MAKKQARVSDIKTELEMHLDHIARYYGNDQKVKEEQVKRLNNLKGRLEDLKTKASYL